MPVFFLQQKMNIKRWCMPVRIKNYWPGSENHSLPGVQLAQCMVQMCISKQLERKNKTMQGFNPESFHKQVEYDALGERSSEQDCC